MNLVYKDLKIRDASFRDALVLCKWWNDGKIMAHAGFPHGLGTTVARIKKQLANPQGNHRQIIEYQGYPIGEMNYVEIDKDTCEIGIKICETAYQEKGLGRIILSMFIDELFKSYEVIILDTNLQNKRAQHVYELLGFKKTAEHLDCWKNQDGILQSIVDYELRSNDFKSYLE